MRSEYSWPNWSDDRLEPPAPLGRTILVTAIALAVGAGLASWLNDSRAESYTGYLESRAVWITASRDGQINRMTVEEGDAVEPGSTILLVRDNSLAAKLETARNALTIRSARLQQLQAQADVDLAWRLKELNAETLSNRLKVTGYLKVKFDRQLEEHAWQSVLEEGPSADTGHASDNLFQSVLYENPQPDDPQIRAMLAYEAAHNAAEVSMTQIQLCEERLKALDGVKAGLSAKVRRMHGIDDARAQVAMAKTRLDRLESQEPEIPVTCQAYGTVGLFRKHIGDHIVSGEPIVEILDEESRYLTVEIPSRRLHLFGPSTRVQLQFANDVTRMGVVWKIPPQTVGIAAADDPHKTEDALAKLRIEPIDKLWPDVPIGSAVTVSLPR